MATQVQTTSTKIPDAKAFNARITAEGEHQALGAIALVNAMGIIAEGTAVKAYTDIATVGADAYAAFQLGLKAKQKGSYVAPDAEARKSQESKLTAPMRLMLGRDGHKGLGLEAGLKAWSFYQDYVLNKVRGGRKQSMLVDICSKCVTAGKMLPVDDEKIVRVIKTYDGNPAVDKDGVPVKEPKKKITPAKALAATLRGYVGDFEKMRNPKPKSKQMNESKANPDGLHDYLGKVIAELTKYADALAPAKK